VRGTYTHTQIFKKKCFVDGSVLPHNQMMQYVLKWSM